MDMSIEDTTFTLTCDTDKPQEVTIRPINDSSPINTNSLIAALKVCEPRPKEIIFAQCELDDPQKFLQFICAQPAALPKSVSAPIHANFVPFAGGMLEIVRGGERILVSGKCDDRGRCVGSVNTALLLQGLSAIQGLKKLEFGNVILDDSNHLSSFFSSPQSFRLTTIGISDETEFANLDNTSSLAGRTEAKNHVLTNLARTLAEGNSPNLSEVAIAATYYRPLQDLCHANSLKPAVAIEG